MQYVEDDTELLYMIYEDNEEAKEAFYKRYENRINIISKKYYNYVKTCGLDLNDLIQEGMMGLTEAINSYKDHKDAKFTTFANICIERKILSLVRTCTNTKNKLLNNSISIDTTENSGGQKLIELIKDETNLDPEEISIFYEDSKEIFSSLYENLTKQEKDVFILRIKGFTYNEISKILNITKKSAQKSMERAKEKIEKNKKYID